VNGSSGIGRPNADGRDEWQVFPIPADDRLTIRAPGNSSATAQVIDPAGRAVMSFAVQGDQASFDLRDLKPGMYLLRLASAGTARQRRFIKR
jgi:hypothetical protein